VCVCVCVCVRACVRACVRVYIHAYTQTNTYMLKKYVCGLPRCFGKKTTSGRAKKNNIKKTFVWPTQMLRQKDNEWARMKVEQMYRRALDGLA